MQFNGRAKDYLATDGEVPNRDAGKLPVRRVRNGSSHLRSLSLRGQRGSHTNCFWVLSRVTVRVNLGAMRGYVRP
jgi:hypothetical protein